MSFLNPFFLLGIAALAVPLLIHIINFRKPQSLPFSTLAFFEELKKSTIRRLRIKKYLLLIIRCAAILLLALALARPFLPSELIGSEGGQQPRAIGLLVDNSASMGQIDQSGPFVEQAKGAARNFLENARDEDRFIVQKTNGEAFDSRLVSASAAREKLEQVEVEHRGYFLEKRLRSLQEQLKQSAMQQAVIFVFTDAQKSQWKQLRSSNFTNVSNEGKRIALQLVKVGSGQQKNVGVTDLSLKSSMLSRDRAITIDVEATNFTDEPVANQFISLEMEGNMVGQYQTDIPAGETKNFLFEVVPEKTGEIKGKVVLEGDPLTFDNQHYFVLDIPGGRSALLVHESDRNTDYSSYLPTTLQAAKQTSGQIEYDQVRLEQLSEDDYKDKDVLILDGVEMIPEYLFSGLQRFVQEGNGVVFLPSEQGDINNYNRFFQLFNAGKIGGIRGEYAQFKSVARLDKISEGHPIIDQLFNKQEREGIKVDRPDVFFNYIYERRPGSSTITILRTDINDPLLVEQTFGDGRVMISTIGADPGWSNFPVNPLFAPVFYRTILYAASSEKGGISSHSLGSPLQWTGELPEPVVTLTQEEHTVKPDVERTAQGYKIMYEGEAWLPGWVSLESGTYNKSFALNVSREESDVASADREEMDELVGDQIRVSRFVEASTSADRNSMIDSAGMGQEIWHWFIWAALLLLMAETFISRWYKAESV